MMTVVLLLPVGSFAGEAVGEPKTGTISGRVFLDENADAVFADCDCDCGLEDIPVRLYRNHCGGLIIQTAKTDEQGFYHFQDLEPGDYCVMPNPKMICEGYQATKSITQKVRVEPGQDAEVEWFGLDHFIDIN
ncbi:MAG: SdrD B-like domain-containing protein [Xanthomonadales bacterium]